MAKKTYFVGGVAATAGLLLAGTPAFADSADNDGINIGNGNNISAVPIQLCGNNVAVLGAIVPILSPQSSECVNAPIVDHASVEQDDDEKHEDDDGKHEDEDKDDGKDEDGKEPDEDCPEEDECPSGDNGHEGDDKDKPEEEDKPEPKPEDEPEDDKDEHEDEDEDKDLPAAPTPVSHNGHAAVTG